MTKHAVRSNIEIVREYTQRVFNEHSPDEASEYLAPDAKWHYRLADVLIVGEWAGDDLAAILYQVGACTPPWLAGASA